MRTHIGAERQRATDHGTVGTKDWPRIDSDHPIESDTA
jgi:hypothetical protein